MDGTFFFFLFFFQIVAITVFLHLKMKLLQKATRGCPQLYVPHGWRLHLVVFCSNDDGYKWIWWETWTPSVVGEKAGGKAGKQSLDSQIVWDGKSRHAATRRPDVDEINTHSGAVFVHHKVGKCVSAWHHLRPSISYSFKRMWGLNTLMMNRPQGPSVTFDLSLGLLVNGKKLGAEICRGSTASLLLSHPICVFSSFPPDFVNCGYFICI